MRKQEKLSILFHGIIDIIFTAIELVYYNYNNKGIIHENITQRTVLKRRKVAVQHESSCDKEFVYISLTNLKKQLYLEESRSMQS